MRYISEDRLKKIAEGHTGKLKWLLECLVSECKELPQQQWQTIEEFKHGNHEGYCFVVHGDKIPMMNFYCLGNFYVDETCYKLWVGTITNVMPIKTPETPK